MWYTLILFELKIFQKKPEKFIGHKSITTKIYWMQPCDSVMSRYFFIRFIDFMLKGKSLLD